MRAGHASGNELFVRSKFYFVAATGQQRPTLALLLRPYSDLLHSFNNSTKYHQSKRNQHDRKTKSTRRNWEYVRNKDISCDLFNIICSLLNIDSIVVSFSYYQIHVSDMPFSRVPATELIFFFFGNDSYNFGGNSTANL
jgi:hypothetical protein